MRKFLIVTAVASCFLFASVCPAQEFVPKGYFGIFGGYSFPEDIELESDREVGLDSNWVAGAKIGGFIARPLILELEYYHLGDMDLDRQILADSVRVDSVFLNLLLRYPEGRFHPFVGAGAGWAWTHLNNLRISAIDDDDNNWAVQALAGVEIDISANTTLVFQYRYFYTEPSFINDDHESKVKSHLVTVGFNFLF